MRSQLGFFGPLLLGAILALSASTHAASRRTNPTPGATRDANAPPQSIPVRIYRSFLVVAEGQFGGVLKQQNFLLDTGTAPSIINERLVRQMGLATRPSTITGLGKTVPTQAAVIPQIALGPIVAVSVPVRVQNFSRLEGDLGIPIAGILGLDVLSKSSFHLDYDKKELEFGDSYDEGIPVSLANTGVAVADVRLGGKTVRMLVDTGSDRVVLFGGNFTETGWLAVRHTSQSANSLIDQQMRIQEFSAFDITVGDRHFSKDRAYLVPGAADPVFDGLLGVRALGFRGLSYDPARRTLYLQK